MIKAIIFDKDGVLIDSELPRFKIFQTVAKKHGIDIPDNYVHKTAGLSTLNVLKTVLHTHLNEVQKQEIIREIDTHFRPKMHILAQPISLTTEFIKDYKGKLKFAIASMGSTVDIKKYTDHVGITDKFSVIMSRDHVTRHKPNPEIYLKTCEALGLKPEECAVVEDTVIGAQAAIAAGCTCYVYLNGLNRKEQFEGMPIAEFLTNRIPFD